MKVAKRHVDGIHTFLPTLTDDETAVVAEISRQTPPFVVVGHHIHVNYTKYSSIQKPIYISFIRDPIDRFISQFYYIRYGDDRTPQNYKNMEKELFNRSLEECVNLVYSEYTKSKTRQFDKLCGATMNDEIKRFCGYDKRCDDDPDYALQRATNNLAFYLAVGLTEELNKFFAVLEKLLPDVLSGITHFYESKQAAAKIRKGSATHKKKKPSETTLKQLKEMATREYEFYHIVKQRFLKQYSTLI